MKEIIIKSREEAKGLAFAWVWDADGVKEVVSHGIRYVFQRVSQGPEKLTTADLMRLFAQSTYTLEGVCRAATAYARREVARQAHAAMHDRERFHREWPQLAAAIEWPTTPPSTRADELTRDALDEARFLIVQLEDDLRAAGPLRGAIRALLNAWAETVAKLDAAEGNTP